MTNAPSLGNGIVFEGIGNLTQYLETSQEVFLGSLKWNGQGEPMPDNGSKLDACSINTIETWILEGARNN